MYSAGIDLGGTSTKLALLASDGRILSAGEVRSRPGPEPGRLFEELAQRLAAMAASGGLRFPPAGGVGIGVAGIVDPARGRVLLTGALGLDGCDIHQVACRALGCPVTIDTDANAGALADLYHGGARGASEALYLSWGTGIGAGIVLGGRLFSSRRGAMGEIGHAPVDRQSGRVCYCGCRGCLEIEAGGRALADRASEALGRRVTVREIAEASAEDPACREILERAARQVAGALASAIVLLAPQRVVVGGGVSAVLGLTAVREAFDAELERCVPCFARRELTVAVSDFGARAGAVGAALLPRHRAEREAEHGDTGA
jgi:glucokinase